MELTKIIKADTSCLIDENKTELMKSICNKYMGKQIFDINLYKNMDDVDYLEDHHKIIDMNRGKIMDYKNYFDLYKNDCVYAKRNRYIHGEIIDDLFVVFISFCPKTKEEAFSEDFRYREYLRCTTIQFYKKDRTCVTASKSLYGMNVTYENKETFCLSSLANSYDFIYSYSYCKEYNAKSFMDRIFEFWGTQFVNGNMMQICNQINLKEWWKLKELKKPTKDMQDLNAIITNYEINYDVFHGRLRHILVEKYGNIVVFRFLCISGFSSNQPIHELYRVFFRDGQMSCFRLSSAYGFCKERREIPKNLNCWNFINMPDDILEIVPFKYIFPLYGIRELDGFIYLNKSPSTTTELLGMLSNNIFEKFVKEGMLEVVTRICDLSKYLNCGFDRAFEAVFGHLGKDTNIKSYLGINQHQLDYIKESRFNSGVCDYAEWKYPVIRAIKHVTGMNNISSMDNNTFDSFFDFIDKKHPWQPNVRLKCVPYNNEADNYAAYSTYVEALYHMCKYYDDNKIAIDMMNKVKVFLSISTIYRFIDVFKMARQIKEVHPYRGNPLGGKWKEYDEFHNDLYNLHSSLVLLVNSYNSKLDERTYKEVCPTLVEKWHNYEYFDDSFKVISPSCPLDIIKEGAALHHCVKSFIPAVNAGETNILFIRRVDDENTPFFTAEVDRNGSIRQIHGLCNCNVNTEEGLQDFVEKWMKERKIKSGSFNRILAQG